MPPRAAPLDGDDVLTASPTAPPHPCPNVAALTAPPTALPTRCDGDEGEGILNLGETESTLQRVLLRQLSTRGVTRQLKLSTGQNSRNGVSDSKDD